MVKKLQVDHNPNILTNMAERTMALFLKNNAIMNYRDDGYTLDTHPITIAARMFWERYQRVLELVAEADPKGKLMKHYGVLPIAPRIDIDLEAKESPATIGKLSEMKFGGYPDLRSHHYIRRRNDSEADRRRHGHPHPPFHRGERAEAHMARLRLLS